MQIHKLHVAADTHQIIQDLTLTFEEGNIHYIFGPNGSGKSTLANVLMGHPSYEITSGDILLDEESILELDPTKRSHKGIYLSMQYPPAIHGVTIFTLLKNMMRAHGREDSLGSLRKEAIKTLQQVGLPKEILDRSIHEGLSGGEKKRLEVAQIAMLKPRYVILDEPDSGLDIDGTKMIGELLASIQKSISCTLIIITHYNRLLETLPADTVTILEKGQVTKSGDQKLAEQIMKKGFSYE